MQALVNDRPDLILAGIPEINPALCPDTPKLLSLGREIPLASGSVDNLFIDTNAILTFVECKRYSDGRVKREVYPRVLNYACDLQAHLVHYSADEFLREFFALVRGARGCSYVDIDAVIDSLSDDPVIEGKNRLEWRRQFLQRLEQNVKLVS